MVGSPLLRNEDCSTLVNVSSVIGICALIVTFGTLCTVLSSFQILGGSSVDLREADLLLLS